MKLVNSYAALGKSFYKDSQPAHFDNPTLVLWNHDLANELLISDTLQADSDTLAAIFSGQQLPDGSKPIATAYAGHQFGHFVPQLGDGRAHLLGDIEDKFGQQRDIQLKGSGQTFFSRGGDGRCAIGFAIREFIMSEAMFALGIPSTRSLAVVTTGEDVFRQRISPGAVITRVASSHVRVGTFQYFAARDDVESLQKLCDYTIQRHYPDIIAQKENQAVLLLEKVMDKHIDVIVEWMRVGFIHGVMNTDNTAISGETIDYGPCAMMGKYGPDMVYSSIDKKGRYAFGNQANIIQWNITRLAECLLPLVDSDNQKSVDLLLPIIDGFSEKFEQAYLVMMAKKLGIVSVCSEDNVLIQNVLKRMHRQKMDYTRTFDALTQSIAPNKPDQISSAHKILGEYFEPWQKRLKSQAASQNTEEDCFTLMRQHNPVVIPRNHHIEAVIQMCETTGNMAAAEAFLHVLRSPYQEIPQTHAYQDEPMDHDKHYQTFCGT